MTQSHSAGNVGKQFEAPREAKSRVEMSEAGSQAFACGSFGSADMEFARRALAKAAPLNSAREAEIRARLASGFYTTDKARIAVAAGVAATLAAPDV